MNNISTLRRRSLVLAVVAVLATPAAWAQATHTGADGASGEPESASSTAPDQAATNLDAVFVTGVSGNATRMQSSVSTSVVGVESIQRSAPRSTAEIFRNIPGIRSEASGGEGNANIAVRGLPVASGGAKFLQLQEDGLPVLEFGDIAFGNADIFLRADYSLDRIEAIRGGSASTFASNSPGGIINFISNTGESDGGSVGVSRGLLEGFDNTRVDFSYGGALNDQWRMHIGGFYRSGDSVRDAGYTAEKGGQIKANFTREFDNGHARFYFKHLNDRAIGILPMPVSASGSNANPDIGGLPGFDPKHDTPHSALFRGDFGLDGENNRRVTDIDDGMHPISTSFGAEFSFELENHWQVTDRFRHADTKGRFVSPFPASVGEGGAIAESIAGAGATLKYANGTNAGASYDGLVINTVLFNSEINDLGNTANDLQLSRVFELSAGRSLEFRAGYYKSRQNIALDWTWNSYLQEVKGNNGALIDVFAADGTAFSQNGLYAFGVPAFGNCCTRSYDVDYDIDAPYAALTFTMDRLTLDASLRLDYGNADGSYAATVQASDVDVNGDGVIQQTERSVSLVDVANPSPVDYDWSYTSYSFGGNYLLTDDLAGFARVSRGGRANADRLLFGVVQPDGNVNAQQAVDVVKQQELGVKWRSGDLSLFVTGFHAETSEQNFEVTSQRFFDRTFEAYGVELEAGYRVNGFSLDGGVTWTDAEISKDQITPANDGNTPRRQADFVYQATAAYEGFDYNLGVNVIGTGSSFAQDNNQLKMPGYAAVNVFANYRLSDSLSVGLDVNNLFDKFAITEVEEGAIVEGQDNIIRARTIPGRSAQISLRYDF